MPVPGLRRLEHPGGGALGPGGVRPGRNAPLALTLAAAAYAITNLHLMPGGGTANSLPLGLMIVAIGAKFLFGVLLNYGVGNYAPTLVMLSLMGMDPRLCFPIMAAGAALTTAVNRASAVLPSLSIMAAIAFC